MCDNRLKHLKKNKNIIRYTNILYAHTYVNLKTMKSL